MSTIIEDLKIKPKLESNLYLEKLNILKNQCVFIEEAVLAFQPELALMN